MFNDDSYKKMAQNIVYFTGQLGDIYQYKNAYQYAGAARMTINEAVIEEHRMKSPIHFKKENNESLYDFLSFANDFTAAKDKEFKPYQKLVVSFKKEIDKVIKKRKLEPAIGAYDYCAGAAAENWGEKNGLEIARLYQQLKPSRDQ